MIDEKFYTDIPGLPQDGSDHIVKATALNGHVKALAIKATDLVKEGSLIHKTSPVVTAAFGRFMTGSLLIAENMKGEDDSQTTTIQCDGPIKGMTCVCDSHGHVRGYPIENSVEAEYIREGKLNVGAAVGNGMLRIIRDIGLREPYVGAVELQTGEIAEDFTYYLAKSEQTPSIVALGVKMDSTGVTHAGGMMIQLMPGCSEDEITYIEKRVNGGFPDITFLMEEGFTPAKILDLFIGNPTELGTEDGGVQYLSASPVSYRCTCSKERMSAGIMTLSKSDLEELSKDENGIDVECHFCNKKYHFGPSEIKDMLI